ncbi:ABC transporter ATP-binding protein [Pseudobacillus badius]|uniref:ABC transporter ATP-binding protein n=1 Tax=Bacillus badius TaxID=1455 RepID=UPI003D34BECE
MGNTSFSFKGVIESFVHWRKIWEILYKADKRYFFIIIILTVLSGIFPAAVILATENLINFIQYSTEVGVIEFGNLLPYFGLFALLTFVTGVSNLVLTVFQLNYQNLLVKEINLKIIEKSVSLPYHYFEDSEIYDMLQRARTGAASKPYQIFESMINGSRSLISLISVIGILISWKWWTVFLLLLIPLVSSTSLLKVGNLFFQVNYKRVKEQRKQMYYLNLLTMDRYVKEIKLFDLSKFITERFKVLQEKFYQQDKSLFFKRFRIEMLFTTLSLAIVIYLNYVIINEAFNGVIAIGSLVAYFQAITRAQTSSQELIGTFFNIYQNNLYVNQLFKFLHLEVNNDNKEFTIEEPRSKETFLEANLPQTLEFRNVSFQYPGSKNYALKNISFCIKKGESVALVGENGSGKSTIIKLITRLYKPTEGEILFNNVPINDIPIEKWSKIIGTVFQDYIQYEFPVYENIGFGDWENIDNMKLIKEAAHNSGAHTFINSLPKEYETQLGKWFDDGVQLSGGQWQRIAIARAYMKKAHIFLLDEPTAALDPLSEIDVFNKLKDLSKDKASIFITHRYSTVKHATKIILIENGEIKEQGTHDELIALQGRYSYLYNTQVQNYLEKQPM